MNLYKIMLQHFAPKDNQKGIITYLVAESDEAVYEWLKINHELKDGLWITTSYEEVENDNKTYEIYDKNYDVIGTETFKERMIRLKGDMNDEDEELNDLYYGLTLYGWELVREEIQESQVQLLQELGISIEIFSIEK